MESHAVFPYWAFRGRGGFQPPFSRGFIVFFKSSCPRFLRSTGQCLLPSPLGFCCLIVFQRSVPSPIRIQQIFHAAIDDLVGDAVAELDGLSCPLHPLSKLGKFGTLKPLASLKRILHRATQFRLSVAPHVVRWVGWDHLVRSRADLQHESDRCTFHLAG